MRMSEYRRQNKKIYNQDETWLNAGHSCNYVWIDNDVKGSRNAFLRGPSTGLKNRQKGKRLIITHIGSEDRFIEVESGCSKRENQKVIIMQKWMLVILKNGLKDF